MVSSTGTQVWYNNKGFKSGYKGRTVEGYRLGMVTRWQWLTLEMAVLWRAYQLWVKEMEIWGKPASVVTKKDMGKISTICKMHHVYWIWFYVSMKKKHICKHTENDLHWILEWGGWTINITCLQKKGSGGWWLAILLSPDEAVDLRTQSGNRDVIIMTDKRARY